MIYFLSYSYPLSSLVESYFSFKDFAAFHFKIKSRCCVYQKLLINGMVQIKVASYLSWFDLEIFVLRQVCQAKRTYHVVLSTFVFSCGKTIIKYREITLSRRRTNNNLIFFSAFMQVKCRGRLKKHHLHWSLVNSVIWCILILVFTLYIVLPLDFNHSLLLSKVCKFYLRRQTIKNVFAVRTASNHHTCLVSHCWLALVTSLHTSFSIPFSNLHFGSF